jgi:hypothetical protein
MATHHLALVTDAPTITDELLDLAASLTTSS